MSRRLTRCRLLLLCGGIVSATRRSGFSRDPV